MSHYCNSGHDPEPGVGHESSRNQDAIDKIMKAVADHNQQTRSPAVCHPGMLLVQRLVVMSP